MRIQLLATIALAACHVHAGAGIDPPPSKDSAAVRYEVSSVPAAVPFYKQLDFEVWKYSRSAAVLHRGSLTLLLESPRTPGNKPAVEAAPEDSNVWNRIVIYVDDLRAQISRMQKRGAAMRTVPERNGVVITDPDGNPIEIRQLGNRIAWQ